MGIRRALAGAIAAAIFSAALPAQAAARSRYNAALGDGVLSRQAFRRSP